MVETILSSPFFAELVLPFLLVFTLIFAILQKSEILGKGKKQIDAIVSLVIGLMVITFGNAVGIITDLMPVLAVSVVVIVIFMILLGVVSREGGFRIPKGVKIAWGITAAIIVIVAVLAITGGWDYILDLLSGAGSSEIITNAVFIILIIAAIAVVIGFGGKNPTKSEEDK